VRSLSPWIAAATSLVLSACYAEIPGSALDDPFDDADAGGFTAGATLGGLGGATMGGGIPGGSPAGANDAGSDTGAVLDAGSDGAITSCDGVARGTVQTRMRYAALQVVAPAACESETQTRTCLATGFSEWSGTHQAESCTNAMVESCGNTLHGGVRTRQRYAQATVNDYNQCVPETQVSTCDDGSWGLYSGTAQSESCQVAFLGRCQALGSLLGDIGCEASTTCAFKPLSFRCVGQGGHSCEINNDCQHTCVNKSCTGASVVRGGSCDDHNDCGNTSCTSGSQSNAASCVANVCACAAGANCTTNAQCVGSCVSGQCAPANASCDDNGDCRDGAKCVKSGAASVGTCMIPNGTACSAGVPCEHVCRAMTCGALGEKDALCDSGDNADCKAPLVCRKTASAVYQCEPALAGGEACEETVDCAQGGVLALTCADNGTGTKRCLTGSGTSCVPGLPVSGCATGVCVPCDTNEDPIGCAAGGKCQ
jgi:hypothetical protein